MRESMLSQVVDETYKTFMVYMGKEEEIVDTEEGGELEHPEVYTKIEDAIKKGIAPESLAEIGLIAQEDVVNYFKYLSDHKALSLGHLKGKNDEDEIEENEDVENPGIKFQIISRPGVGVGVGIDETTIPEGFDYTKLPAIMESEIRKQVDIEPDEYEYEYEYEDEDYYGDCDCELESEEDKIQCGCQYDDEDSEDSYQEETIEERDKQKSDEFKHKKEKLQKEMEELEQKYKAEYNVRQALNGLGKLKENKRTTEDETEYSDSKESTENTGKTDNKTLKDFIKVERDSDVEEVGIDLKGLEDILSNGSVKDIKDWLNKLK